MLLRVGVALACILLLGSCSCTPESVPVSGAARAEVDQPSAFVDSLLDAAVQASGTQLLDSATAAFRFRENLMGYDRRGDAFVYTREHRDSAGVTLVDVLSNAGVRRYVNGSERGLSPKQAASAAEGVNSIIYFAFLPRALRDDSVRPSYRGVDTVRGRAYHLVHVRFDEAGGGADFEDEFLYWFDIEDASLDFLAYAYATNGGGLRLREAYNARRVNGVAVQDYRNYRPEPPRSLGLDELMDAYREGRLTLLSTIALEDVRIERAR